MFVSPVLTFVVAQLASAVPSCIPGAQLACACIGGTQGIQVCNADGASLSTCDCGESEPAPGAKAKAIGQHAAGSVMSPVSTADRGPRELPFSSQAAVPMGYSMAKRPRWELLETGLGASASLYLAGGIIASMIDAGDPSYTSHRWLYLPVAGPFLAAANPAPGRSDSYTFILVADGLIQTAGVAAAIYALVVPEKYLLRDDLVVAPMATKDATGFVLRGSF